MNNTNIDHYVSNIMQTSFNKRKDAVKDFLRYRDNDEFFKFDEEEEILETKNIWAGFAYLILIEQRLNNIEISEREEDFLEQYFERYLLTNKEPVGLEEELKGFYLKHRISEHFEEKLKEWDEEYLESVGLYEFKTTIQALINELYGANLELVPVKDNKFVLGNKFLLTKNTNELMIDEEYLTSIYNTYQHDKYDLKCIFELINELSKYIELRQLNEAKKHDISKKSVVYTVEDYLESKANKKNKLGEIYKELYLDIIANKQIFIDASVNAYEKLEALEKKLQTSSYPKVDEAFKKYLSESKKNLDEMLHYYGDARFFDTTNLEEDAFSKLYDMYIKGLKAMPKSQLTNVTKYFVVNGSPLTTLDMDAIENRLSTKISKEKNEEKKAILEKKYDEVKEVIDFVKSQSYSYELEEEIRTFIDKRESITNDVRENAMNHYNDLMNLTNRILTAIENTEQLASSGSASKIKNIMEKRQKLLEILYVCVELAKDVEIDLDRDIVISKVSNKNKAIAMLQELTGNKVLDCERMLDLSISNGEPVMRDLNPGFKKFARKALEAKGVKEIKIK